MVILDAPSVTISNDTTFMIDRRAYAYDLTGYIIGENMYAYALMDTIKVNEETVKVYGEDGFWESPSSCSIPVGGILSCNTGFFLQSDGSFKVEKGATVFNSKDFILCGSLIIEGSFVNNSVIQCRLGSSIEGDIKGIGYQADYISYVPTSTLSVASTNTAVVIDLNEECPIESIFASLSDDRRSVSITVEGSQRIYVDKFTISLHEISVPEDFDTAFRLDIIGIDSEILGLSTVKVSLPTDSTMRTIVYGFNTQTNEYETIGTSQYDPNVLFTAGSFNQFYLQKYIDEVPNPNPPDEDNTRVSNLDCLLMAAIVAVLCVTVYALVTMKRY